MSPRQKHFDAAIVDAADRIIQKALDDVVSRLGSRQAVVTPAPAGAGKTGFVIHAVGALRRRSRRVAVATPTNEQAFGLVRRIAEQYPNEVVAFVPASAVRLPEYIANLPNVREIKANQSAGAPILVGTLSKFGDAWSRNDLAPADVLIIDESYQADSSKYYAVGGIAPTHLLVGDSGQLNPFSTFEDESRWRGLPEDPLQTAVGVLLRNHPDTPVHPLPITRRLDPRAVPVVRAFYPSFQFAAAVKPGVREMMLLSSASRTRRMRTLDKALETAATSGWAHLELPSAPVLSADPETIRLIVELVSRLFHRQPETRCEWHPDSAELKPMRVAVGVSHNDQKDLLRVELNAAGHDDVVVDTANRLQGLEFDVVIAWHPLAGLLEADEFHLDPGRTCVLLTRHRHACIVVVRAADRELLDAIPPPTPAYLGHDPDPVLDGWAAHQSVFEALEPYRIEVS